MIQRNWSIATQRAATYSATSIIRDIRQIGEHKPMSRLYRIHKSSSIRQMIPLGAIWDTCYASFDRSFLTSTLVEVHRARIPGVVFRGFLTLVPQPAIEGEIN